MTQGDQWEICNTQIGRIDDWINSIFQSASPEVM